MTQRIDIDAIDHPRERILRTLLRTLLSYTFALIMRPGVALFIQRRFLRTLTALATFAPRAVQRRSITLSGRPGEHSALPNGRNDVAVLYLHGGAFVSGSPASHRAITGHLARALDGPVYALDYRLAPESPAPAALEDALGAWHDLLAAGWRSDQIALAGDSAGGNLALVLAQELRRRNLAGPAALLLFSPWIDLASNELNTLKRRDPLLVSAWLQQCAQQYRGTLAITNPLLSPLHADLSNLPPTLVQVGTQEILLNDSLRLLAQCAATPFRLEVYDQYWHVFQVHAGVLEMSTRAIAHGAEFIRSHAGTQSGALPHSAPA